MIMPAWLTPACAAAVTSPKSATLTSPWPLISTFSGLTSRCTSPSRWASAKPGQHRLQHGHRGRHPDRAPGAQHVAQRAALDQLHDQEQ